MCLLPLVLTVSGKPAQAQNMARQADGVIIGSAIVKLVAQYGQEAGSAGGGLCARSIKETIN